MVLIHEKITALLEQRRLKKRDLARALGISPQTATDICKGRSAITLPHLRNLVTFFHVRADFWLDDARLTPELQDNPQRGGIPVEGRASAIDVADPERLLRRLRSYLQTHRAEFLAACPDLTADEKRFLGLQEAALGVAEN